MNQRTISLEGIYLHLADFNRSIVMHHSEKKISQGLPYQLEKPAETITSIYKGTNSDSKSRRFGEFKRRTISTG